MVLSASAHHHIFPGCPAEQPGVCGKISALVERPLMNCTSFTCPSLLLCLPQRPRNHPERPPIRPPLPMLQADQSHLASFHPSQLTCPLMLRTCSSFLEHFLARRKPSFDCVCPPTVPLSGPHFSSHQHCRPRTPRLPEVLESCWSFWLHHILLRAIDVLLRHMCQSWAAGLQMLASRVHGQAGMPAVCCVVSSGFAVSRDKGAGPNSSKGCVV